MPRARSREAASEAVELAASAGLHLDPWQQAILSDALGERADGTWAAFEVGLVVPRQNGKGSILEARELAGLFLFDEELILHSAHEFKTASEAFRRILQLVQSTPDLDRRVMRVRTSHGDEGIELRNGHRLRFVARSTGSGRGFSGDCVILDEAYNLTDAGMSALLPTMSARPNPQIWYTSSGPLERAESSVLRKLIQRGRAGESKSLAFMEFCAAESDDPGDPKTWAKANPSFPHRISADFIAREREALEVEDFARERLGIWYDLNVSAEVVPLTDWLRTARPDSELVSTPTFALEVTEDRAWSTFAVAGTSSLGGKHGELIDPLPGTGSTVARAVALTEKHGGGEVVVAKGSAAAALVEELTKAGVSVYEMPVDEQARACGLLLDDIRNGGLWHLPNEVLDIAVRNVAKKAHGVSGFVWEQRKATVDVTPLAALSWASARSAVAASDGWLMVLGG